MFRRAAVNIDHSVNMYSLTVAKSTYFYINKIILQMIRKSYRYIYTLPNPKYYTISNITLIKHTFTAHNLYPYTHQINITINMTVPCIEKARQSIIPHVGKYVISKYEFKIYIYNHGYQIL